MKRVFLCGLGLGLLAATAGAALPRPIPPADQLFTNLHRGHPRLLATAADFTALRSRVAADEQLIRWHAALTSQATALLTAPASKYEIPDGLRLLATSRRVLDRVQTLGLLWQLDHDRRWADRAWRELKAAAAFKDWNPRHFLDTAEMTHAFAIGYDWLYDAWNDAQRRTLQAAIVKHGFTPALAVYAKGGWWVKTRNNWNQVCNGGLGIGALALAEVEPALAARVLHTGLNSVQTAMGEFAPDGACIEGPGYWHYATRYQIALLAALQSALGTDFDLATLPGVAQTGWFPLHITSPIGQTFNYADGGSGKIYAPQLFWLARRFQQPVWAGYQARTPRPQALDVLWYSSDQADPAAAGCRWTNTSGERKWSRCAAVGNNPAPCSSASRPAKTTTATANSTWAASCWTPWANGGRWILAATITICPATSANNGGSITGCAPRARTRWWSIPARARINIWQRRPSRVLFPNPNGRLPSGI